MYLFLKKKGYSPAAAAEKVNLLQLDYSNLSDFERTVARRAMPFYTFSRRMSESLFKQLAERPGGPLAQAIRSSAKVRDQQDIVPEHVASSISIPWGKGPKGDPRYITGLGLMHEEPAALIGSGAIPFINRQGVLEAGSKLTPLAKAPLEWMAGKSFFQTGPSGGRPLEDLDPTMARTLANIKDTATGSETRGVRPVGGGAVEHVMSNTPLTRLMTSTRTFFDPRKSMAEKAWNLLTGFRTTTVSEAQQDKIISDRITDIEQGLGGRKFESHYIPDDIEATLNEEELRQLESIRRLRKLLKSRKKKRNE